MKNNFTFFPKFFISTAIWFYIIILIMTGVIFYKNLMPTLWIAFGLVEVITFFYFSYLVSKNWAGISEKSYRTKLFWNAFLIRALYIVFSYFFYIWMTGQPFEFLAADAHLYDELGTAISDQILAANFHFFKDTPLAFSDKGFPILLGIIYTLVFKSILLSRIVLAIFGAWSCLLVYALAKRNFGETAGRISGILMMLVPNLIYYCGLQLKEVIMTFLCIAFINLSDKLLRYRQVTLSQVVLLMLTLISLFLFRTVLGLCAVFSLAFSIILISSRTSVVERRFFAAVVLFFGIVLLLNFGVQQEVNFLIQNRTTNQQSQMENYATVEGGNKYAAYGSNAIFLAMIIPAPFPTLIDVTGQENQMMINGNNYTRNVYAFFVFVALFILYKRKIFWRHVLLVSILISYLLTLGMSGFALSERFHVPAIPFLLIIAGYGITQINEKNKKYFIPYMILMTGVILGWNWFKLAGRM